MIKIALIGRNGSGKSTVCDYLANQDATVISLSDYVRAAAKSLGRNLSRESLIKTANDLKTEHGHQILAQKAIDFANKSSKSLIVFDSIRHPDEARLLKTNGTILLGIQADLKKRYERIQNRGHSTDQVDWNVFQEQDDREGLGKSSGQSIDACFDECQHMLINDGSIESLYEKIDHIISTITGGVSA